ncbi:MAG: helix-turn-helix domain-containing protein [Brotaphodocola sp.]
MESNIKYLREQRRMTQQQLGDMLGLSQQIISRMELDRSKIQVDVLIRLADYFNVSTDYVLGYENENDTDAAQIGVVVTDGDLKTDILSDVKRLEQLNKSDRMKIWKTLVELKKYI